MTPKDLTDRQVFADGPEGLVPAAETAHLTGLEYVEAMRDGRLPAAPIARLLGFRLIEVAPGRAVFRGAPGFEVYNPAGVAHGGWFGTLLDSCMACAAQTRMPAGKAYTTLEYKVNLLRAATAATGPLLAIGESRHAGRRTAVADGRLVGESDGKLYATASTTCLILDL